MAWPVRYVAWLPFLAAGSRLWELEAKLVDARELGKIAGHEVPYLIHPQLKAFAAHFALVLREPITNSCRWAHAIQITEDIVAYGYTTESLRTVHRCGPGYEHLCKFYDEPSLRREPKLDLIFRRKAPNGYAGYLIGRYWSESRPQCPDWLNAEDPFIKLPHPLRRLHPKTGFWDEWLRRSLLQAGFDGWHSKNSDIVTTALEAMPEVCSERVVNDWPALVPQLWPESAPKAMIAIGCSDMTTEPTQPLLKDGVGGLFADVSSARVESAKQHFSAPNRVILNLSVQPHSIGELLKNYSSYVKDVEVLQVDVDTLDGRLVEELLAHTKPRAAVVEVRDFLPFPFRYACLSQDTKTLPWGGANFAFWLQLMRRHGLHLARLDPRDAVFGKMEAPTERRFLGTMACYLRHYVLVPSPVQFVDLLIRRFRDLDRNIIFRHHWLGSHPADVVDQIWRNMTTTSTEIRFHLDF